MLFFLANFHIAGRAVFQERLGMQETDMFSSYSLRRSMPTLAEMRKVHPDDADALGDWTSTKDTDASQVCGLSGREGCLSQDRAYARGAPHGRDAGSLDWEVCRHFVDKVNNAEVCAQANHMLANDSIVEENQKHFLEDLAKPRRRLNIAALKVYMKAKHGRADAPPTAPQEKEGPTLPVTSVGADRVG